MLPNMAERESSSLGHAGRGGGRDRRIGWRRALGAAVIGAGLLAAAAARAEPGGETIEQALCRMIDGAARRHGVPGDFLTRLIWRESSFRTGVVSPAGAQGVAQFMPGTARERGLADPFDPEQAIPEAARLIRDLRGRFGNLGLAAAAYNGGPGRVSSWLAGQGELPLETRSYVFLVTGRSPEDWAAEARASAPPEGDGAVGPPPPCLTVVAALRRPGAPGLPAEAPIAPWGVQLAGNFSKERALASFLRARQSYASLISDTRPMVIGTRLRSRGTRAFYRVRVPAPTRADANELCARIRSVGGSCIVLPS